MCAGDFNEILYAGEKWGGEDRDQNKMEMFKDALDYCDLEDLGYQGPSFTWSGVRAGGVRVSCRVDRVAADGRWQEAFPSSQVLVKNNICQIIALSFCTVKKEWRINGLSGLSDSKACGCGTRSSEIKLQLCGKKRGVC